MAILNQFAHGAFVEYQAAHWVHLKTEKKNDGPARLQSAF